MDIVNATLSVLPKDNWNARCIAKLPLFQNASSVRGPLHFVDSSGTPMSNFTDATWGVSIENCYQYCNMQNVPYSFNFQLFASAFSNFLLPWLALTAQLPYEAASPWDNLLSLCMAVGSPALITYSLTITILNRYSLRTTKWHALHQTAMGPAVHGKYPAFSERIKAMQYLLQEAQQVPLRASQERGWLSSLIVGPKNQPWWRSLKGRLSRTRRGVTFSLIAQILAALVAWLFTVASAFLESRGDRVVANQLSSGTLWLWLVPVICGWVTVGTQNSSNSIDHALRADIAYRAKEPPVLADTSVTEKGEQRGIMVRSVTNLELPRWLGADIIGDEKRVGPIFNYARVFTWWQLARTIESALTTSVNAIDNGKVCMLSREKDNARSWNVDKKPEDNLAGDSYTTAQYCGLDLNRGQILAYPKWNEITADVWKRICVAGIVALFVQWGTTGPGMLIAYYTPTVGIGCRTAGYVFYGVLATAVWVLLAASMLFSHAAMLRYQREHWYERTTAHSILCGLAVVTRLLGKAMAILSAIWLVLSSLLEFTGVYDRCYCKGNEIGLGKESGWLVLFKTDDDLAQYATSPWAGGVAMSILICFGSYGFFFLASRESSNDD
ncbi:hypothetical protein EJ04DRAFT_496825 [Polyplosphaeria fusca]|uniref:Uncharacterized protein n=1 Tax=Polyplosphaeria fusca TaxID=682080 RepID=A0A9P4QWJ9_9PLEO|nr:hypothetical protein EJ04DRAFT_496825 [Polyplosphaeria fusca]